MYAGAIACVCVMGNRVCEVRARPARVRWGNRPALSLQQSNCLFGISFKLVACVCERERERVRRINSALQNSSSACFSLCVCASRAHCRTRRTSCSAIRASGIVMRRFRVLLATRFDCNCAISNKIRLQLRNKQLDRLQLRNSRLASRYVCASRRHGSCVA